MNTTQNTVSIDLGTVGWQLAAAPGWTFGSKENALRHALENNFAGEPVHVDTRPTVRDVLKHLREAENARTNAGENANRYGCAGPWDEYFSAETSARDEKWPHGYRWISVFVVVGGSEGLYLHVEAIGENSKDGRRLLILGKTCAGGRETWARCYESAANISWILNT